MANRRSFLAGLLAAGFLPRTTWADIGRPKFLSAARKPDGRYVLCGLSATGNITFDVSLPGRGHAAAAHPKRAEAIAFARRPGIFGLVLDCASGRETARLLAPPDRHFYGHGAFSADGRYLFTTENDFEAARGVVGIWDAANEYTRLGEFASGGVGPHDIKLMPDGNSLVIANGGIETHPETGRTKLNIPTMRPNLTYVRLDGMILDKLSLEPAWARNSIRHLAVGPNGAVAFAMQWQGDLTEEASLLGIHNRSQDILRFAPKASIRRMHGYLGSVAISKDGSKVAVTSPRAGRTQVFETGKFETLLENEIEDVCGVAESSAGFVVTSGTGSLHSVLDGDLPMTHNLHWDNHLISL